MVSLGESPHRDSPQTEIPKLTGRPDPMSKILAGDTRCTLNLPPFLNLSLSQPPNQSTKSDQRINQQMPLNWMLSAQNIKLTNSSRYEFRSEAMEWRSRCNWQREGGGSRTARSRSNERNQYEERSDASLEGTGRPGPNGVRLVAGSHLCRDGGHHQHLGGCDSNRHGKSKHGTHLETRINLAPRRPPPKAQSCGGPR